MSILLDVKNLKTYFNVGLDKVARAVDGVSFSIDQGKTLAIVGESGCGKTQTAFSIIRLIANNGFHPSGQINFNKRNLSNITELEMQSIRGNDISMIFQEPMTSLNPLYRIGNQLEEPLCQHRKISRGPARKLSIDLLDQVGIPDPHKRVDYFPHELSGGMKQRVMIAMALACKPKLLIADEPTTALDVTIQAQVLKLMFDIQKETGMTQKEISKVLYLAQLSLTVSLDESFSNDQGEVMTRMETMEDKDQISPERELDRTGIRNEIKGYIQDLSERERLILALYYYENLTLADIGTVLNLSEGRVSQILSQVHLELRHKMKRASHVG